MPRKKSAQPPSLSFRLKQGENVALPNRSLHISHDETVLIIDELHPHLSDLPTRPGPANHLDHHCVLDL